MDDHTHPNCSVYVQQLDYSYHIGYDPNFDENSAELPHMHDHKDKNFGEKVVAANYDIHVGAFLGMPTKILALVMSLVCASLPVTGFMVWLGWRNKAARND